MHLKGWKGQILACKKTNIGYQNAVNPQHKDDPLFIARTCRILVLGASTANVDEKKSANYWGLANKIIWGACTVPPKFTPMYDSQVKTNENKMSQSNSKSGVLAGREAIKIYRFIPLYCRRTVKQRIVGIVYVKFEKLSVDETLAFNDVKRRFLAPDALISNLHTNSMWREVDAWSLFFS